MGELHNLYPSGTDVRFEVFMAMKIHIEVFWVMTLYIDVAGYPCFRGPCCLHFHAETFHLQRQLVTHMKTYLWYLTAQRIHLSTT